MVKLETKRYVYDNLFKKHINLKKDFFGSAPAPFVGNYGYPNINVGILSPPEITENAWEYDAPKYWAKNNYKIPQILSFRTELINSRFKANVKDIRRSENNKSITDKNTKTTNRFLDIAKEIGLSLKPVDVEISLDKAPNINYSLDRELMPMGPRTNLENVKLCENPHIKRPVDKVFSDTDFKAGEAINYLYKKGFEENYLSEILSVGTLGIKTERKLVPTRWSITAIDDTIGKDLLNKVRDFGNKINYSVYFGGYLGNYYLILFFPEVWSYELIEIDVASKKKWTDYEFFEGRKDYASNCVGGYYASRLAVLEKMMESKRQGSALCLRFCMPEYEAPLGVWVVREAVRKALKAMPLEFGSKELMLQYAKSFAKTKFGLDLEKELRESKLLDEMNKQKKLWEY